MWYVYVLRSKDGELFIGTTNDLDRCMEEHGNGSCAATADKGPLTCETFISIGTQKQAKALEKYFGSRGGSTVLKKHFLSR